MYAPYQSETEQVICRARVIFKTHRLACVLWTACYMLLVYGYDIWRSVFPSPLVWTYENWIYLAVVPLLLCLYGWLHRIIRGESRAVNGLFDPFRWIVSRSVWRFLLLALTVAAAAYAHKVFMNFLEAAVYAYVAPAINSATKFMFGIDYGSQILWVLFPLVYIPGMLLMQWIVDFFCIHAVQTDGKRAWGIIFPFGPIYKKTIRHQARLMRKTLWIPYLFYYLTFLAAKQVLPPKVLNIIYYDLMFFAFLGFGFVYYPLSAIARSLLVMQQPRVAPAPAEPMDCTLIDEAYQKELAARRLKDEEDEDENEADGGPEDTQSGGNGGC